MEQIKSARRQQGATLAIALILLIAVTVLSLSSLSTGLLEMVMAANEEARMTAFQQAQAGLEAVINDESNFPVVGGVGDSNCTSGFTGASCNQSSLQFPTGVDTNKHAARTERLNPLFACPPRAFATSCDSFKVAHFAVDSRFDDVVNRGGRSQVVAGLMMLVPQGGEETVITDNDYTTP